MMIRFTVALLGVAALFGFLSLVALTEAPGPSSGAPTQIGLAPAAPAGPAGVGLPG